MYETRHYRGPDPRDALAFGPQALPAIRSAVADLSWLLSHGYATSSSLKLVGDRWSLTDRQRKAVLRCACSDEARERRRIHECGVDSLRGQAVIVDGFNVLTTLESALGGAPVLRGRDAVDRDLAGVHGTYRRVEETLLAVGLVGAYLEASGVARALWLLDRPVSNSGRLRRMILDLSAERGWAWEVELPFNPDPALAAASEIVATADSVILDHCECWFNLARATIERHIPEAHVVDLGLEP